MSPYEALADAYEALLEMTERVYLPGQLLPDDEAPLIRLDPVGTVDRVRSGGGSSITRLQVSVWASNLDQVFPLHEQARERLLARRYVPDGGGPLSDPETSQVGWRADYRRQ